MDERSPSEPYPGPEPDGGGQPAPDSGAPAQPSSEREPRTGEGTPGEDVAAGDGLAMASFGPTPEHPSEPQGPVDMAEKQTLVQNPERLDLPPVGQPDEPPSPRFAVSDPQSQSHPPPDPPNVLRPISHDDDA